MNAQDSAANSPPKQAAARMKDGFRFRRTFIALHVEAGTYPKLVQTRVGHSNIKLTINVYGKLAGEMALAKA